MSLFAKIMVVVNFILAVVFLAAAGTLLGAAEDYKAKYNELNTAANQEKVALNAQIDAERNKNTATTKNFGDLQAQKAAVDAQLKTISDSNSQLNAANNQMRADLDKLTSAQSDLNNKLTDLNKQVDSTRNELATSESERKAAIDKNRAQADEIARLSQDKETAEKSLAAANTKAKSDADQLDNLRTTLEMYKKEKGALSAGVVMNDVHGVVQACNNNLDIYVLSVGSKDGVKEGYEFTIYRDSKYVTTIVIDKVFPNYSSGMSKPGTKKMDVMPGDEAATRL
jgi:DNA repair exonuclease SbcCD ATPase subunit